MSENCSMKDSRGTESRPTILFIAIIHDQYQSFNAKEYGLRGVFDLAPHKQAFLSLTAWLRLNGCEGHYIWVGMPGPAAVAKIEEKIAECRPDAIGFSLCTEELTVNYRLIEMMKEKHPGIPIIVGGHHVSAMPRDTIEEFPLIDYVAIGEGESTLTEWLKCIAAGGSKAEMLKIKGLAFRDDDGKIVVTQKRGKIEDVNILPDPAYDLIFEPNSEDARNRAFPLVSSYGCYYHCTFCAAEHGHYRYLRPERVVDQIERAIREFGARYFAIRDSFWPPNLRWLDAFCDEVERRKLKFEFHFSTRVDYLRGEHFERLKRIGMRTVAIGVEAGDPRILEAIKKGITVEQAKQTARILNDIGIFTVGLFMVGNQYEDRGTIDATVNLAAELNTSICFFSVLAPFPGTEAYGFCPVEKRDWWKSGRERPSICGLREDELESLSKTAYIRYPLRWRYVVQHIIGGRLPIEYRQLALRLFIVNLRKYVLGISERYRLGRGVIRQARRILKVNDRLAVS